MGTNWPTHKEDEERSRRRAQVVAKAFAQGEDPAIALIQHDESLLPEERKEKKLNNPTYAERIKGASPRAISTHRMTTALETVEVKSTLDHLLKYAEDKNLGRNALDVLGNIINGYLKPSKLGKDEEKSEGKEDEDGEGEAAIIRTRDALEATKLIMSFYKDSREFSIKRAKMEGEETSPEVESLEE